MIVEEATRIAFVGMTRIAGSPSAGGASEIVQLLDIQSRKTRRQYVALENLRVRTGMIARPAVASRST